MYSSKVAGTFWSSSWVKDSEIDKMLDDARTTSVIAKRLELYKKVQDRLVVHICCDFGQRIATIRARISH